MISLRYFEDTFFLHEKIPHGSFNVAARDKLELLSRLELPNLFLTKEVLYRLSQGSKCSAILYILNIL